MAEGKPSGGFPEKPKPNPNNQPIDMPKDLEEGEGVSLETDLSQLRPWTGDFERNKTIDSRRYNEWEWREELRGHFRKLTLPPQRQTVIKTHQLANELCLEMIKNLNECEDKDVMCGFDTE